jgi:formate dehydrogenase major subunit
LKERARKDPRPRNAGLNALTWDYTTGGVIREPVVEEVLQEINGRTVNDGKLVAGYRDLKADGSTSCGCWIYSGIFPNPNENVARKREPRDFYGHGWGFAWPADRRILYNRASARPDGRPWSERKKLIWWDENKGEWTGLDVPDFTVNKAPDYRPPENAEGDAGLAGDKPFIMHAEGLGRLYVPSGLKDGPLPTHYEPLESPIKNPLYPARQVDPGANKLERPDNQYADSPDERFPYVATTYRLTEHHTAGGMSRWLPYLSELQPEFFCEISPQLAAERGLEHLGWATIVTARNAIEARVMVTARITPLTVRGRTVHQIGLPFHWGPNGVATGDAANELVAIVLDPNAHIQEDKALTADIRPGRRPRGPDLPKLVAEYRRRAGITAATGTETRK